MGRENKYRKKSKEMSEESVLLMTSDRNSLPIKLLLPPPWQAVAGMSLCNLSLSTVGAL